MKQLRRNLRIDSPSYGIQNSSFLFSSKGSRKPRSAGVSLPSSISGLSKIEYTNTEQHDSREIKYEEVTCETDNKSQLFKQIQKRIREDRENLKKLKNQSLSTHYIDQLKENSRERLNLYTALIKGFQREITSMRGDVPTLKDKNVPNHRRSNSCCSCIKESIDAKKINKCSILLTKCMKEILKLR